MDSFRLDRFGIELWHGPLVPGTTAAARAGLRRVLAEVTGLAPEALRFVTGAAGKPVLADDGGTGIAFNLSHARTRWVAAVSWRGPVGVDVEEEMSSARAARLAVRALSGRERAAFARLGPDETGPAVTRAWVRKEAVAKADGRGLAAGIARFEVGWDETGRRGRAVPPWRVIDLDLGPGCYGAVAFADRGGFFFD